ncbi:MAG: hypothetical protein WA476_17095 [Acidobacteriaceae bacterium]
MRAVDIQESAIADLAPERILAQVELMTQDDVFRTSKRSTAFLTLTQIESNTTTTADPADFDSVQYQALGRNPG